MYNEWMQLTLQEISNRLMVRRCELGQDKVGVLLKGKDPETDEIMELTVTLKKEDEE